MAKAAAALPHSAHHILGPSYDHLSSLRGVAIEKRNALADA